MRRFRFRASVAAPILVLVLAAAGGVVAATQSSDEQALQPTRQRADKAIESRVSNLLSKMTLQEKLEQIQLLPDFLVTEEEVRKGLGSVLSVTDPQQASPCCFRSLRTSFVLYRSGSPLISIASYPHFASRATVTSIGSARIQLCIATRIGADPPNPKCRRALPGEQGQLTPEGAFLCPKRQESIGGAGRAKA